MRQERIRFEAFQDNCDKGSMDNFNEKHCHRNWFEYMRVILESRELSEKPSHEGSIARRS